MSQPIALFSEWLTEARQQKSIAEPTAMSLATVNGNGQPSVRIVLLKAHDERGFVFYTNLESRKSDDIRGNPKAALCFHWMPLEKQVRIEGHLEAVSDAEADAYFATRPRESQIGAWSSQQSRPLDSRDTLVQRITENTKKFEGKPVPRPHFWSGWRLVPDVIEFWEQGAFRLHDRALYTRSASGWSVARLYP